MAFGVFRKSSVQPDERVAAGGVQLAHRVPLLGGRGAHHRQRLLLELLGASGRHVQPAGERRLLLELLGASGRHVQPAGERRRWRSVRRRVGLRRRRRCPIAGVRADEQRHGQALLHAVRHTTEAGDCALERRKLSQLSRLLHAVRESCTYRQWQREGVSARGKRLCCRPHPCLQSDLQYSYGYNDGISVDCEQYAKLGCNYVMQWNLG